MTSSLLSLYDDLSLDEIEYSSAEELDIDDESEWQHMTCTQFGKVSLSVTPVDGELLSVAQHEIKALCRNARDLLNKPSNEDIGKSECINYFLDSISGPLSHAVRQGLPSDSSINGHELETFIRVLVFLSIYGVTPSKFFDPQNAAVYPHAANLNRDCFDKVMKALKKSRTSPSSTGTWNEPFQVDVVIRDMEMAFTSAASRLALIKKRTILSIDDDQYRVQSALTEDCRNTGKQKMPSLSCSHNLLLSRMWGDFLSINVGFEWKDMFREGPYPASFETEPAPG